MQGAMPMINLDHTVIDVAFGMAATGLAVTLNGAWTAVRARRRARVVDETRGAIALVKADAELRNMLQRANVLPEGVSPVFVHDPGTDLRAMLKRFKNGEISGDQLKGELRRILASYPELEKRRVSVAEARMAMGLEEE